MRQPKSPEEPGELDPATVTTRHEFAILLRRLRVRAGKSLRDLERWARAHGASATLARTTVSDVLAGRRLPSHDFVDAFVEACGVVGADKRPWLDARVRIAEYEACLDDSSTASPDASTTESPSRHLPRLVSPRRALIVMAGVVVTVVALVLLLPRILDKQAAPIMACIPESCETKDPRLTMYGQLPEPVPNGYQPYLLTRVENTQRWYLGNAVTPGPDHKWSQDVGIGNPAPQPKDRDFKICLYLLPATSINALNSKQLSYAGAGLQPEELPTDRKELACTPAKRLK